ncbi:ABC transporter permease [Rothia sp. ZJ1223]|nr:ABC transporter permease [Rothia sp. ZJ1223]
MSSSIFQDGICNPMATHAAPASRRIIAQGTYETVSMLKNAEQLMLLLAFPVMALCTLRFTGILDTWASAHSISRIDATLPGVLALSVMSTAFSGQGIATGFDRRYGVLRFLSTTPLGRGGLIAGKLLAVVLVLMVQVVVICSVAFILGWQPDVAAVLASLPTLLLGATAFTSLGLLIAGTVRAEATLAIVNMAWVILAGAGGILIPGSYLPGPLSWFTQLLPSGALGEALRAQFIAGNFSPTSHLILLLWALVAAALASKYFKWSAS